MCEAFQILLAVLRGAQWTFQSTHWQVFGESFYGDHLMFQRLYESLDDEIDTVAEKMVAMFGPTCVNPLEQSLMMVDWLSGWNQIECPIKRSLTVVRDIQETLKIVKKLA